MKLGDMIRSMRAAGVDPEQILATVEGMADAEEAKQRAATREKVARHRAAKKAAAQAVTYVTDVTDVTVTRPPTPLPPKDYQNPSPPLPPVERKLEAGAGARAGFPSWPADAWEQFIERYPNRRKLGGPRGARAAFGLVAMRWSHRLRFADLLAAVDRYVATKPADENWLLPVNWLEDERWTDEAPAPVGPKPSGREAGIVTVMRACMERAAVEEAQGGSHGQRTHDQQRAVTVTRSYSTVRRPDRALDRGAA